LCASSTDGTSAPGLFRARFTSRLIDSEHYFWNVQRYIDDNPVAAGLVDDPAQYPYGRAWFFSRRAAPSWLNDSEVDESVGRTLTDHARWVVERRLE
jgi:hypothetical protein